MSSSSDENIVDYIGVENEGDDNLIDWFDIEIENNENNENSDFHIIEDMLDDYDLLETLNESSSNIKEKSKNIINNTINNTINKSFMIDNNIDDNIDNNINENKNQKQDHVIIEIPETECFVEPIQTPIQTETQTETQTPIQEENKEIIKTKEDVKEYQNDLYNYLNVKYFNLLNRLSIINSYIFARPYMHRFGNTINSLYNRVYYFFENNINMIYNIGVYFGLYGFVRVGYNLIIRNQYRYIKNYIRNVRYYLYNLFS